MKLSILLLTHNRPELFDRAIRAIIPQLKEGIEVIVNNDSNDIREISHPLITYRYRKFINLSDIYKFLFNQSKGEYVYFAEDDDYVTDDFIKNIWEHLDPHDLVIALNLKSCSNVLL